MNRTDTCQAGSDAGAHASAHGAAGHASVQPGHAATPRARPDAASETAPVLVSLQNVTVGYDRHPAIHHLQLQISAGDMLAVVGPNGAGKSTFLKLLIGEQLSLEGQVTLPDPDRVRVACLPQINQTDRQFPITVQDMVASGLWHQCGAFGRLGRQGAARVAQALEMVGLRGYAGRVISALSGGEFQRVRFAQLILQDAQLVVLDEPFVGIDVTTQQVLLDLLARWHAQGVTIVAALHEQDIVRSVAARQPSTRWCEGPTAIPAAASAVHRGAENAMPRV